MVLRPFIRRHLPFLTKGDSSPLRPQDRHLNYSIFGDSTKKAKPNKNGVSTAEYGSGTGTTRGLSEDYGLEDMGIGKKRNDSDVTAVDDLESAKGRGWPLTQDPSGKEERA